MKHIDTTLTKVIKKLAKMIKKEKDIKLHQVLEVAAIEFGFDNYYHVTLCLKNSMPANNQQYLERYLFPYKGYNDLKESKKMNTSSKQSWHVTLLDTGDAIIPLPDELMVLMGWTTHDILSIEYVGNCIKLTKKIEMLVCIKRPKISMVSARVTCFRSSRLSISIQLDRNNFNQSSDFDAVI